MKASVVITLCLTTLVAQAQSSTQTTPPAAASAADAASASPREPPPGNGQSGAPPGPGDAATTALRATQLSSAQFFDASGFTVQQLVETGSSRRADLLAARQRLVVAEGRLLQVGVRPNPTLDVEYGTPRFVAGEAEQDLSVGVSQIFETGGKRSKRSAVARLELAQARSAVLRLEQEFAAEVRAAYARAVLKGRQLDALEGLINASGEQVRITDARLKEGDVAPVDLNLVQLESDRLRAQVIRTQAELESELITLRTFVGFEMTDPLRLAPFPERPPRLDRTLAELTQLALRERPDLRAARLGEELGTARIGLAKAIRTPNIAASVRLSRNRELFDLPARLGGGDLSDTDTELTFGVAVELPFFNRNQGGIAAAAGERIQATRQREFLEASIRRDVALAYRRYQAAAEALALYATRIMPRAEQNIRSVRAAYNLGEFSAFDIVNEQRRLIESQTGYNEALGNYYSVLVELERALGTPVLALTSSLVPPPSLRLVSTAVSTVSAALTGGEFAPAATKTVSPKNAPDNLTSN